VLSSIGPAPLTSSVVSQPFVPDDFEPPLELSQSEFRLVPLAVEHNESDRAAWMSSIAAIHATPGWESRTWPPASGMSLEENRADLERHARDFTERTGFTFTVLDPVTSVVIGCVYIYPATDGEHDAEVRSWVRADRSALDPLLHAAVTRWLADRWPLENVRYADRR
jgi:RimJ/RimL family protein N-acetyltransferase